MILLHVGCREDCVILYIGDLQNAKKGNLHTSACVDYHILPSPTINPLHELKDTLACNHLSVIFTDSFYMTAKKEHLQTS